MKALSITSGILAVGFLSGTILSPCRDQVSDALPDSLQRKVIHVDSASHGGSWNIAIGGFQGGDTLTLTDWLLRADVPIVFGCCHEAFGWYDTLSGTNVVVPAGYQKTDTIDVVIHAIRLQIADRPVVVISGQKTDGSFRFSRSTEVRLEGDMVYYNIHDQSFSKNRERYTRPLLINKSLQLKAINTSPHKAPSPPTLLNLIKITDFERIGSSPVPTSTPTPDNMFRLVDGDTTNYLAWNTCNIEILLNPGVARTPASLTVWFGAHPDKPSQMPDRIFFDGSDDGQEWKTIASKKTDRKKMRRRPVAVVELPARAVSYRYFRIRTEGPAKTMTIAETALRFGH